MKFKRLIILALLAIVNTACTTIFIPYDFSPEKYPDEGVLVVSTSIPDFEDDVRFQLTYHIKKIQKPDLSTPRYPVSSRDSLTYFALQTAQKKDSSDFSDADGQIHARALKAGRYELTGWTIGTGAHLYISPKKSLKPISFEIIPGKITYLGNIHMNNSYGENIFGVALARGGIVTFKDREARDIKAFRLKSPDLSFPIDNQVAEESVWLPEGMSLSDILKEKDSAHQRYSPPPNLIYPL